MINLKDIYESILISEISRDILPTQLQVEQYLMKLYPAETENKLFNDNYGLYSNNPEDEVKKILLCTTPTRDVVQKFKKEKYDLLICHHDYLVGVPQIIFHSIMDEEDTYGHNKHFANRIGLKDVKKHVVTVEGNMYKPLTLEEFIQHLEKRGFKVNGVVHKNNQNIKNEEDALISTVIYCSGHGGMLINNSALNSMSWQNDPNFDLRNVHKDVYVTGQIISRGDLKNNKFKYVIELGHTSSEKPLFKYLKNRLLNKWPNLTIDLADNSIDYFGVDMLGK